MMTTAASHPAAERPAMLAIQAISKAYGATIAVRNVSLDIKAGEIHAVLGENGAGKSTIVKVLSGIVAPDGGTITLAGARFAPRNPMDARQAGVSTAFQELSLLPNLTVAANIMLPHQAKDALGLVSAKRSRERSAALLDEYGLGHIHPDTLIRSLSLADKQRIEIMRAVSRKPKLLVLDEPTAALADPNWLFTILARITAAGTGVLYISHRLSEVRKLCERGTILRNGESIGTFPLQGLEDDRIFEMMVGVASRHEERATFSGAKGRKEPAISLSDVVGGATRGVSIEIGKGEIVGIAALEGQGQRDLFRMLAGLRKIESGQIRVDGKPVSLTTPAEAGEAGIGFVPEERKTEGVFLGLRTDTNITLSLLHMLSRLGIIDRKRERVVVRNVAKRVDLAERYLRLKLGELSGGNQQKALIGRVLASGAKHLVLYDPTRGVDVGTKAVIYGLIRDFVGEGGSALIYSTELSELVHLVHRCLVMYRGKITGEVSGTDLDEQRLVALATGHGAAH